MYPLRSKTVVSSDGSWTCVQHLQFFVSTWWKCPYLNSSVLCKTKMPLIEILPSVYMTITINRFDFLTTRRTSESLRLLQLSEEFMFFQDYSVLKLSKKKPFTCVFSWFAYLYHFLSRSLYLENNGTGRGLPCCVPPIIVWPNRVSRGAKLCTPICGTLEKARQEEEACFATQLVRAIERETARTIEKGAEFERLQREREAPRR
jgi:hypothetical protein